MNPQFTYSLQKRYWNIVPDIHESLPPLSSPTRIGTCYELWVPSPPLRRVEQKIKWFSVLFTAGLSIAKKKSQTPSGWFCSSYKSSAGVDSSNLQSLPLQQAFLLSERFKRELSPEPYYLLWVPGSLSRNPNQLLLEKLPHATLKSRHSHFCNVMCILKISSRTFLGILLKRGSTETSCGDPWKHAEGSFENALRTSLKHAAETLLNLITLRVPSIHAANTLQMRCGYCSNTLRKTYQNPFWLPKRGRTLQKGTRMN